METATAPDGGNAFGVADSRQEVEEKLLAGIGARRSIRRWVSGTLLAIALVLRAACYAAELHDIDDVTAHCLVHAESWACSVLALISLSAAPLKGDARLTRIVIGAHICVTSTQVYFIFDPFWHDDAMDRGAEMLFGLSLGNLARVATHALFVCFLLAAIARREADDIQIGMWRALQVFFAVQAALDMILHMPNASDCWCCLLYVLPDTAGLAISLWPGFLGRVHSTLAHIYDRHSAKAAAASIAGLMGHCTVNEVMSQATARFRAIRADLISEKDLAKKELDPLLYQRSEPARLGSCDAFVSHSWSDNSEGKWKAFRQWREAFVAQHGHQPTIWLDKCCIDQTSIETDLRCLPIFLSGCKEMVVFCGTTYFSRLWCILELFAHNHLGLGSNNLTVIPVLSKGSTRGDPDALMKAISGFDVNDGHCSCPKDRSRIMEIILVSFSSSATFNQVVREMLHSTGFSRRLGCELASLDAPSRPSEALRDQV